MTKRLFIAIGLSESLADKLADYQRNLALEQFRREKINWTKKENLHLTVHFLAEVEIKKIEQLISLLGAVAKTIPVFDLVFKEIIFAPPRRQPRMIWATFHGHDQYQKLATEIYRATKDILFEIQEPKFLPHLTLARFRFLSRSIDVGRFIFSPLTFDCVPVASFCLFASELTATGPIYTNLARFDLSGWKKDNFCYNISDFAGVVQRLVC